MVVIHCRLLLCKSERWEGTVDVVRWGAFAQGGWQGYTRVRSRRPEALAVVFAVVVFSWSLLMPGQPSRFSVRHAAEAGWWREKELESVGERCQVRRQA